MTPGEMTEVIERRRYSTKTATLLAHDNYWDGSNMERRGRNQFLYRTPNGRYFTVYLTQWQGEHDRLEPLALTEAEELYERLHVKEVAFEDAFPTIAIEEA